MHNYGEVDNHPWSRQVNAKTSHFTTLAKLVATAQNYIFSASPRPGQLDILCPLAGNKNSDYCYVRYILSLMTSLFIFYSAELWLALPRTYLEFDAQTSINWPCIPLTITQGSLIVIVRYRPVNVRPVCQLECRSALETFPTCLTILIFAESREETNCLWPAARGETGGTRTAIPAIMLQAKCGFKSIEHSRDDSKIKISKVKWLDKNERFSFNCHFVHLLLPALCSPPMPCSLKQRLCDRTRRGRKTAAVVGEERLPW